MSIRNRASPLVWELNPLAYKVIGSKADGKSYLNGEETERHCVAGVSVWKKYSTDGGDRPDVILVGIGVETTTEVIVSCYNDGVCSVSLMSCFPAR